jgi:hypothetical protein
VVRVIKTLLLVTLLAAIAALLGFFVTFTISWTVQSPMAEYLEGVVCLLLIAGVAWGGFSFFRSTQP